MIRIVAFIGGGDDINGHWGSYETTSGGTRRGLIYPLFDTLHMERFPVTSATIDLEVNKAGTFEFTVAANHPVNSLIHKFRNYVFVAEYYYNEEQTKYILEHDTSFFDSTETNNTNRYDDAQALFYGRTTLVDTDLYGNKTVTCEGAINFLNDIISKVNDFGYQNVDNFLTYIEYYGYYANIEGEYAFRGIDKAFRDVRMRMTPAIYPGFSEYTKIKSKLSEIENNDTILNIFNTYVLKECGGFFVPQYPMVKWGFADIIDENSSLYVSNNDEKGYYPSVMTYPISTLWYTSFQEEYGVGDGGTLPLMLYDGHYSRYLREFFDQDGIMHSYRHKWLPFFCVGKNVISVSKEPALNEIITGVYPVGKNGLLLQNSNNGGSQADRFIWDSESVYIHSRIAVALSFPDIDNRSDLRYVAQKWLSRHIHAGYDSTTHYKSLANESKITVTGPEPCEFGYGKLLVSLMRDVFYSDDPSTDTSSETVRQNTMSRPVLSMHIDVFNPQSNTYTFGPYISDNYSETTISTTKKELKLRSEYGTVSSSNSSGSGSGEGGEGGSSSNTGGEYIEDGDPTPEDGVIVVWEPDPYTPPEVIIDL